MVGEFSRGAAVALANKNALTAWALLANGGTYRQPAIAAAQRLPRLMKDAEATLAAVAGGGIKLHPDTVAALAKAPRNGPGGLLVWAALAALALAVAALA